MFGFIVKVITNNGILTYNGVSANLRYCMNVDEARNWIEQFDEKEFKKIEKGIREKKFRLDIPIIKGEIITDRFNNYLIDNKNISSQIISAWAVFLKELDVVIDEKGRVGFAPRERVIDDFSELPDGGLMRMKDFMMGLYRLEPVKVMTDKKNFVNINFEQHFDGKSLRNNPDGTKEVNDLVTYVYKGKKFKTPIYGVYTPQVRNMMFEGVIDFGGGRVLQKRQTEQLYYMGYETYLAAPREGGKCVIGTGLLRLYDGSFKMAKDISIGDRLLSSDGKGFVNVIASEKKEDIVYEVKLNTGEIIEVTKEHKFPTQFNYSENGFLGEPTTVEDMMSHPSDFFIPTNLGFEGKIEEPLDELRLLGIIIGDGGCTETPIEIGKKDLCFRNYIVELCNNIGIQPNRLKSGKISLTKGKWFQDKYSLYHKSINKVLPNFMFSLTSKCKFAFIEGLFNTDTYIDKNGRLQYFTTSYRLAKQVKLLLSDLGVISILKKRTQDVNIKGKTIKSYVSYVISIYNDESLTILRNNIDIKYKLNNEYFYKESRNDSSATVCIIPKIAFKQRTTKGIGHRTAYDGIREPHYDFCRWKCNNYGTQHWLKYQWSRVISITKKEKSTVIDIQVDGDNLYWTENVLTHNSLLAAIIASLHPARTVTNPREKIDGPIVYYYGISHPSNKSVVNKILRLNKKFRQGELYKWSGADKTLYFMDGSEVAGYVEFLSDDAPEPGRGGRPKLVIVDEAARISDNTKDIISGFHSAQKFYISTIQYETKKNWFYDGLKESELKMNSYPETMDDLVVELWHKYKFDKIESIDYFFTPEGVKALMDCKSELMRRRSLVGFRYTIDDVEYLSEEEREAIIEETLKRGYNFMRAELFSEYVDDSSLFEVDKCKIQEEEMAPQDGVDFYVVSIDNADQFDNAAYVVIGAKKDEAFCFDSQKLPTNDVEKIKTLKDTINYYRAIKPVFVVADCTNSPVTQRAYLEDRGITIDCAIKSTPGGDFKPDKFGFTLIGKKTMIEVCQKFFNTLTIRIPERLDVEEGIFEEFSNFQSVRNPKTNKISYKAIKGKDDQVHALLYGLFFLYMEGFKDSMAEKETTTERRIEMNDEDFYEWKKSQKKILEDSKKMELATEELFGKFGY